MVSLRRAGAAGSAAGCGEGAEFFGAVVTDRVDADDFVVDGQLYGAGDDGDLHVGECPGAADAVVGAGEADAAVAIGTAGDGDPDGRLPCPRHRRCQPRLVVVGSLALHMGGDPHTGVEDVDQPTAQTTSTGSPANAAPTR